MLSFMNDSITRLRSDLIEDSRHNLVPGPVTEQEIKGCSVQPGASGEVTTMRDTTKIVWTVFAPYTAEIVSTDRIKYGDRIYEIDGEPERWKSPTGALSHVRVFLVRWEG